MMSAPPLAGELELMIMVLIITYRRRPWPQTQESGFAHHDPVAASRFGAVERHVCTGDEAFAEGLQVEVAFLRSGGGDADRGGDGQFLAIAEFHGARRYRMADAL